MQYKEFLDEIDQKQEKLFAATPFGKLPKQPFPKQIPHVHFVFCWRVKDLR